MIIVVGGSRGIGAATAALLAEYGVDVAVSYRQKKEEAEAVAELCRTAGREAVAIKADITKERDIVQLFDTAVRQLGPLTGMVMSAGIVAPQSRLQDFNSKRVERMMAVNVTGAILCAREAVLRLSTANGGPGGAIVFVSSAAARGGSPGMYVDYAASKGAIDTLTVGLSKEVAGEGIRVNAVRPGIINTEIHADSGDIGRPAKMASSIPLGRAGDPGEVAHAIAWLMSGGASYVTGALLDVSGGR